MLISQVQAKILGSILNDEYGDIRSMLDEYLPNPTFSEQLAMSHYLDIRVIGARFTYETGLGWWYDEEDL